MPAQISFKAFDKKTGVTLDQLGKLIQDAHRLDIPGDASIHATVSLNGRVQTIKIEG